MKKTLTALLALAAVSAALPAAAQSWDGYGRGPATRTDVRFDDRSGGRFDDRFDDRFGDRAGDLRATYAQLDMRIDRGVRDGSLSRREAWRLSSDLRGLRQLDARYRFSGGGLDRMERADLERRAERLSFQIRAERHDGDRRDGGRRGW